MCTFIFVENNQVKKMKEKFMIEAIKEATKSLNIDEVPVGAVIVRNQRIIARGHNLKENKNSSLAHAEIIAIQKATIRNKNWRLNDCDIYVTLEPCPMCASAIKQSRIKKVYYGASTTENNHKIFESICNTIDNNKKLDYEADLMKLECTELLKKFFKKKR